MRVTVLLLASLAAAAPGAGLAGALASHGLRYTGKGRYAGLEERAWGGVSRRLSAASGAARLRVLSEPDADAAAARRRLDEWAARFLGQFDGDAAYPGMVTKSIATPEALRPRRLPVKDRAVWVAPATEALAFGAGAEDLAPYRAVLSQRWCAGAGRTVELALFYPAAAFVEKDALAEEASFTCARPR
jgi:hypothetical protein